MYTCVQVYYPNIRYVGTQQIICYEFNVYKNKFTDTGLHKFDQYNYLVGRKSQQIICYEFNVYSSRHWSTQI
jgi:hypothetical protein